MKIILISNAELAKKDYFYVLEEAIEAGIYGLIIREKNRPFEEVYAIAKRIKPMCEKCGVKLIINGQLEVAKALEADAYHQSFKEFVERGKQYPKTGISIHSLKEALEAEKLGADYLLAGHIYETNSKKGLKPRGLSFFKEIKDRVNIPVMAIGGINPENASELINFGADGIAIMSYIMASENPKEAVEKFKEG